MAPMRNVLVAIAAASSFIHASPGPGFPPAMAETAGVHVSEAGARLGPGYGTYVWPVQGPVLRGFEPPPDPYGEGHRGIDIGAPFGTTVAAAQAGAVAFAGWVGGSLFVSIDHADGVRTTYSWLSGILVAQGDTVVQGASIGQTGQGHPGSVTPHLHFGARVGSTYIDPMLLLEPGAVAAFIHLAPLDGGSPIRPQVPEWEAFSILSMDVTGSVRGPPHARP